MKSLIELLNQHGTELALLISTSLLFLLWLGTMNLVFPWL